MRFEKAGAKKRGTLDIALEIACAAARQRYRRLRLEKMMQFSKEWERFWEDVRCDHVSVWNILRRISGKIATMSCMASPEEQRRHISELSLIQENADFDEPRVQEAIDWINEFLREGRGTGAHPGYTEKHVKDAFHRLNECASGVDGLTKKAVAPALLVMLSEITALFSFLRTSGLSLDEWSLSVIQLVKKRDILL